MTMRWAKVTSLNPLRVRLDGESTALAITPRTLVDSLGVGDVVRCDLVSGRELIIVGRLQDTNSFIGEHRAGEWLVSPHPSWVLANGAVLNIVDYPRLAAHYAAVYGAANFHGGNGLTTFAVPDTRERVYVNQGGSDIFAAIGAKTGTKTHTLTEAEMPAHSHQFGRTFAAATGTARLVPDPIGASLQTSTSVGGGAAHNNVQPSFVVRYVIRAA